MRLGFVFGFLAGAAIASVMAAAKPAEAPDEDGPVRQPALPLLPRPERHGLLGFVDSLRAQTQEAKAAGREAAAEKEAEMRRAFDEAIKRRPPSP